MATSHIDGSAAYVNQFKNTEHRSSVINREKFSVCPLGPISLLGWLILYRLPKSVEKNGNVMLSVLNATDGFLCLDEDSK